MIKLFKIVLILISLIFILISVCSCIAYKKLSLYKNILIDEKILNSYMDCGPSVMYAYDFYDRENRIGKEYVLENFTFESSDKFYYVDFEKIPKNLINAFIAIEDKRFYKHNGIDFLRTGKACFNYLIKNSTSFGGSTITQQLVKNITGDSQKNAERKIKEAFYAMNLEKAYTKEEILTLYLNIINLGNGCRGVGSAARFYFSKDIGDLTLSECATIASITKNPSVYNPITNSDKIEERRILILNSMYREGYISKNELDLAIEEKIVLHITNQSPDKINSWYMDMVIEDVICDLEEKYNISRSIASNMLYYGNLRIYTAIDEEIQNIVENYYRNLDKSAPLCNADGIKSSFIVLDFKTGDILGVVGDIGKKKANRIQSFATNSKRPSGSAIKPLSVYAPALERGIIDWSTIYEDSPIEIKDGRLWPQNSNGKYVGDVDIEYAIANSLNTVSTKVLRDLTMQESLKFLKETLNISSLLDSKANDIGDMCESSLAMGQHKNGITLMELTSAYTVFENGVYKKPRSYFKVTDAKGNIILDNEGEGKRAISQESAAIMTKLLQSVVADGTAKNRISLSNKVDVAGKTGTTSNNCDRYFIGYTPEIIGGCWLGYEYPRSIEISGNPTLTIWNEVASKIYSLDRYKNSDNSFTVPNTVKAISYDKTTGKSPNLYSDENDIKIGWFEK